jgi:copper chaperone
MEAMQCILAYPTGVYSAATAAIPPVRIEQEPESMSDDRTYNVSGMTCGHCKSAVVNEVLQVPGVRAVDVDLEGGVLTVRGEADDAAIRAAVDEAGYAVV